MAASDGQLLLDYCLRHFRPVSQEVIEQVVAMPTVAESGALTSQQESAFWSAFAAICKLAAPASAESVKLAKGRSYGRAHTAFYAIVTVLTLLAVLSVQIFWVVGGSLVSDVTRHIAEYDATETKILDQHRRGADISAADGALEGLYLKLRAVNAQLQTDVQTLHGWNMVWAGVAAAMGIKPPFVSVEYAQLGTYGRALVDTSSAQLMLRALFAYLLPFLYGALGACVYIVREASREIRSAVFTQESAVHFFSRLVLGPIAGVAIGLLIVPEQSAAPGVDVLRVLSLPALAFVAGYSVDIVFVLMDRFISAVRPTQAVNREAGS